MTRKIYRDFLLRKARERQLGWVARAGGRYARILASQVLGRPLCGPVLATLVTNYSCNFRCGICFTDAGAVLDADLMSFSDLPRT